MSSLPVDRPTDPLNHIRIALEVEQVSPESDWDFTDLALERVVDD